MVAERYHLFSGQGDASRGTSRGPTIAAPYFPTTWWEQQLRIFSEVSKVSEEDKNPTLPHFHSMLRCTSPLYPSFPHPLPATAPIPPSPACHCHWHCPCCPGARGIPVPLQLGYAEAVFSPGQWLWQWVQVGFPSLPGPLGVPHLPGLPLPLPRLFWAEHPLAKPSRNRSGIPLVPQTAETMAAWLGGKQNGWGPMSDQGGEGRQILTCP